MIVRAYGRAQGDEEGQGRRPRAARVPTRGRRRVGSSPPAPRRAGREATMETILAAAEQEFALQGYDGTSVREVAARAGVTHALVHRYFGTKTALYRAVLARNENLIRDAAVEADDLTEAAQLMIGAGLTHHREYLRLIVSSAVRGTPYDRSIVSFGATERLIELARSAAPRAFAPGRGGRCRGGRGRPTSRRSPWPSRCSSAGPRWSRGSRRRRAWKTSTTRPLTAGLSASRQDPVRRMARRSGRRRRGRLRAAHNGEGRGGRPAPAPLIRLFPSRQGGAGRVRRPLPGRRRRRARRSRGRRAPSRTAPRTDTPG